jgi:hypothetical protein
MNNHPLSDLRNDPILSFVLRKDGLGSKYLYIDVIWITVIYPALIAFLLVSAFAEGTVLSAAEGDIAYNWLWSRYYLVAELKQGRLPVWNPYIMSGTPFLAGLQGSVFYPLNILFLFSSVPLGLNLQILTHWWLTFAGWHLLGRRLGWQTPSCVIASVAAGFSGWAVLHLWQGHLHFILEMAAMPWLLWAWVGWKRSILNNLAFVLWTALLVALQFSIGHPQIVYFSLLVLIWLEGGWLFHSLGKDKVAQCFVAPFILFSAIACGIAIMAVQAFPTLAYMRETVRGIGRVQEAYYTAESMPWSNVVTLVAPWAWGGWPGRDIYVGRESVWEVVGFVGATSIVLAFALFLKPHLISRFQFTVVTLFVFGLVLALGGYIGFYPVLRKVVPGLGLFRNPGRALYIVTIATALLAGEGLERMRQLAKADRAEFLSVVSRAWVVLAGAVASFLILFSDGIRSPIFMNLLISRTSREWVAQLNRESVVELFQNFQINLLGAGLIVALALVLLNRLLWHHFSNVASWALVGLLIFELTQFARPYMKAFHPERHEWPRRVLAFFHDNGQRYRITSIRTPADLNQGMRWRVRHVWGYEPTVTYAYASCIAMSQGRPPGFPEAWLNVYKITPLINVLGVRYLIAPPRANLSEYGWKPVLDTIECSVHENEAALARGYLVGGAKVVASEEAPRVVNSEDFLVTETVVLEKEQISELPTSVSLSRKDVRIVEDGVSKFVAEIECDADAWFVLMDDFLPGWSAQVDNETRKIYRANACGMAVRVPAGKHLVAFSYKAPGLEMGMILSVIGVLAYLNLLGFAVKQRKNVCRPNETR